jgi:hypothetical protein
MYESGMITFKMLARKVGAQEGYVVIKCGCPERTSSVWKLMLASFGKKALRQ